MESVESSCECANEHCGSIKCWETSSVYRALGPLYSAHVCRVGNNRKQYKEPVESNKCQGKKIEKCKKSARIRKIPITKLNYFFMVKHSNKCNSKTFSKNTFKIFHQNIRGLKNLHLI
jgi:hypothetical protein